MASELAGTWKLVSSEKFEEYMKEVGVGYGTRKIACSLKPDVIICINGDNWSIKTESTFKNTDLSFVLNTLFEETTADGRKCQTIITLEDGKLIQNQTWDDKKSTITREVKNGQMITTCIFDKVTCVRVYEKK